MKFKAIQVPHFLSLGVVMQSLIWTLPSWELQCKADTHLDTQAQTRDERSLRIKESNLRKVKQSLILKIKKKSNIIPL